MEKGYTIYRNLFGLLALQISYHKHNLKPTLVHYIYHKNKKGKPCQKDLPLLKNDITNNLGPQKPVIYSRYQLFGVDDFESNRKVLFCNVVFIFPNKDKVAECLIETAKILLKHIPAKWMDSL